MSAPWPGESAGDSSMPAFDTGEVAKAASEAAAALKEVEEAAALAAFKLAVSQQDDAEAEQRAAERAASAALYAERKAQQEADTEAAKQLRADEKAAAKAQREEERAAARSAAKELSELANQPSKLSAGFTGLAMSVGVVTGGFGLLGATVMPFVQAFNPSGVLLFTQALRDTAAVIGSALTPVLSAMTGVVRNVADQLMPLMRALSGPLRQISGAMAGVANIIVNNVIGALTSLTPILEFLAPIFEGVGYVVRTFNVLLGGFINTLMAAIGNLFGDKMKSGAQAFADTLQQLSKTALIAAASLAKMVGWDNFVKGMIGALGGNVQQGQSTGFAAAQNAQVTDATSFARSLATAAATATEAMGRSPEDQWRAELLEQLKKIEATGRTDIKDLMTHAKNIAAFSEELTNIGKNIQAFITSAGDKVKQVTHQVAHNAAPDIARIAQNAAVNPNAAGGIEVLRWLGLIE